MEERKELEQKKDELSISFRARTKDVDVSKMATELGGGGHPAAAGAKIEVESFEEGVEKILQVARKYAKKKT